MYHYSLLDNHWIYNFKAWHLAAIIEFSLYFLLVFLGFAGWLQHMTCSQLNSTNAVQNVSFSKCGFSTFLAPINNSKHVYGVIIVGFLQKIVQGASWWPPGGPRVPPILSYKTNLLFDPQGASRFQWAQKQIC